MKMKKNGPVSVPRPSKPSSTEEPHAECVLRASLGVRLRGDRRGDAGTRSSRGERGLRDPRGCPRGRSRACLGRGSARRARTYPRDAKPMLHFSCSTLPTPGSAAADARRRASWPHERTTVRRERHPERVVEKNDRFLSSVGAPRGVRSRQRRPRTSFRREIRSLCSMHSVDRETFKASPFAVFR